MLISRRIYGLQTLHSGVCICTSLVIYFLIYGLFNIYGKIGVIPEDRYVYCAILICLALLFDAARTDRRAAKDFTKGPNISRCLGTTAMQTATAFIFVSAVSFATKDRNVSRFLLLIYFTVNALALFCLHMVVPGIIAGKLFKGRRCHRALLLGPASSIPKLNEWVNNQSSLGLIPIGAITLEEEIQEWNRTTPRLGHLGELSKHLRATLPSLLIFVDFPQSGARMREIMKSCDQAGTRLLVACDIDTDLADKVSFFSCSGAHLMSVRQEPLESPWNRLLKRSIDILVALPVTLIVLPVATAIVWFYQRLQSPGPVFFRQERTGIHNEVFLLYKFRTMHVNNPNPAQQATRNDSRIFPAGRWLRKFSIDELPQFINVLLGEMSVVGPRPHLAVHDCDFEISAPSYRVRHWVKPGITGLAQVRGFRGETRSPSDVIKRTDSDIDYLEHWSLEMEISIILRTFIHVLKAPPSAY